MDTQNVVGYPTMLPEIPPPIIEVRSPYETVHELLEELYVAKCKAIPSYGNQFRDAWAAARRVLLDGHGWTEKAFYDEMDRRRKALIFPELVRSGESHEDS